MNQKLDQWSSPLLPHAQFADGPVPYNVIDAKGLRNKLAKLPDRTAPLSNQINQVRDLIQQASAKKVDGNFIKQTGDNVKNPSEIKVSKVRFPQNKSQVKHIFRDVEGHLPDNQTSRQLLQDTVNDTNCYLGKDKYGNTWYGKLLSDKTQVWVQVRNDIIQNGGVNNPPRNFGQVFFYV